MEKAERDKLAASYILRAKAAREKLGDYLAIAEVAERIAAEVPAGAFAALEKIANEGMPEHQARAILSVQKIAVDMVADHVRQFGSNARAAIVAGNARAAAFEELLAELAAESAAEPVPRLEEAPAAEMAVALPDNEEEVPDSRPGSAEAN